MRIVITTIQLPFVFGGAELLANNLKDALIAAGHDAAIVALPFKSYPPERIPDHLLACRLFDLTGSNGIPIDKVIGLKFPAYCISHPNKVLWILHQHRTAYDLWDHPVGGDINKTPDGLQIRAAIKHADQTFIPEAKRVYTIAHTVTNRLKKYCDLDSTPLYHPPPNHEKLYCAKSEDYFFYPSRISALKRQSIVVEALALTKKPVCVYFAGTPDYPDYLEKLKALAKKLNVTKRIKWLGRVSDDKKIKYYAHSLGVIFPPVDEDYGYITLEAMLSSKPVITCKDSGEPSVIVSHNKSGSVCEPTPKSLAKAMDKLWSDRGRAKAWGAGGLKRYNDLGISWDNTIQRLLA